MRTVFYISFFLLLVSGRGQVHAQSASRRGNIWYFGYGAGMDFNTGAPRALTDGKLHTDEGCASIADSAGRLLFYTDGVHVWNKHHVLMPQGKGLMGDSSTTQSAVIVPRPGHSHIYYLFTLAREAGKDGFRYSVVDMSQDSGRGDVVQKNILLYTPSTERLCAVQNAAHNGYWIITHQWETDSFYVYSLTATGLSATPVRSRAGPRSYGYESIAVGQMTVSADGTRLGLCSWGSNEADLFTFDNSTGKVSNAIPITNATALGYAYGISFSPDASKVYICNWGFINGLEEITQFDVSSWDSTRILSSRKHIQYGGSYGSMQQGPDGRIYVARPGELYVGVIANPNAAGTSCNYSDTGVYLNGRECAGGLPALVQSFFSPPAFSAGKLCYGDSTHFAIEDSTGMDSVVWNFGDSPSGRGNTSRRFQAAHVFSALGQYTVSMTVYEFLRRTTVQKTISILSYPAISLGHDTLVCKGFSMMLGPARADTAYRYHWQDSSALSQLKASQAGTYWLRTSHGSCVKTDTLHIAYISTRRPVLPRTRVLCTGNTALLDVRSPGCTYRWQDGDTSSRYKVTRAGRYIVMIKAPCDTFYDTCDVMYIQPPQVMLGSDTTLCDSARISLYVHAQNATWLWQDGSTDSFISVRKAGTYYVTARNMCGAGSDTVNISYAGKPQANLGRDTLLCEGDTLRLNAYNAGSAYRWQDGSTNATFTVKRAGTYYVSVRNACHAVSDTLVVRYMPLPVASLGRDTILCTGGSLQLHTPCISCSYQWQDGSTDSLYTAHRPGLYAISVHNYCGAAHDTIIIQQGQLPVRKLGRDTTLCAGDTLRLTVYQPGSQYLWQDGSTAAGYTVRQAGRYHVDITNACGALHDSVQVQYRQTPQVQLGKDTLLCLPDSLRLDAHCAGCTYQWQDGSGQAMYTVHDSGIYMVQASNQCGMAKDSIRVSYEDCHCYLYMPTVFSPNNDGLNERYMPIPCPSYLAYTLRIFNRWGELLFETGDMSTGWDGIFKGQPCQEGMYLYSLTAQGRDHQQYYRSGSFYLLR